MKTKFFDLAKRLSKFSEHHQHKLGAIITDKNRVVGLGFNKSKTNPKSPHKYKSHHAEFDAILNSERYDLRGCDIYVYRETRLGELAISFPCESCYNLLKSKGIKNVYYTDNGNYKEQRIA
jgi:dCMP deaminase